MSDVSESGRPPAGNPSEKPVASEASAKPVTNKPKIGDSRPAPTPAGGDNPTNDKNNANTSGSGSGQARRRRRRRSGGKGGGGEGGQGARNNQGGGNKRSGGQNQGGGGGGKQRSGQRRNRGGQRTEPVGLILADNDVELDEDDLKNRRGRTRKGRAVGRYLMVVSKQDDATHIAVLEGRTLIEYYVSRPNDDISQIHGNIYLGRVQNVLPGMEAAFVDIGTPKNAVIYRGDVQYDKDDFDGRSSDGPKIEQMLKARQSILCQVTKNPIAHKGARLTTEVSLPGRFVVLVPNSDTYGISKRLPDDERKRLRQILDRVRPANHGLIVRTAAENVTAGEIERDVAGLVQ
ncbi:MAG: ribonuclease E/G, partial [Actinomycetota bacterium]